MKAKIIKVSHLIAVTSNGEEHVIDNYPLLYDHSIILHEDIEGEVIKTTEQDKYNDGSFARSYTEVSTFTINEDQFPNETKRTEK